MKKPLLLGLLALLLVPTSLASAQSDNAYAAYDRKDVAALTRMAKAGDPVAQYNLGVMYAQGEGLEQDYTEAVKWYRKAADQGRAEAQYNLGVMYDNGEGVEQDYVQALKWYNLSAASGDENAKTNRDALEALMTSAQIEEAQRLSLNVQPQLAVNAKPPPTIRTVSVPPPASTKITLSSDGKTIIISGDIDRGSAERFKILLDAVPSVKNVALVSP